MILGSKGTFIFQSTLPRRERLFNRLLLRRKSNFNPRSREGSDSDYDDNFDFGILFQSTLPRRERRRLFCNTSYVRKNFNPRSREGSDFNGKPSSLRLDISIHAPAKGATLLGLLAGGMSFISIHAPAKGATSEYHACSVLYVHISIHAPAKGATNVVYNGSIIP